MYLDKVEGKSMANIDLTKQAVTITGNHFFLSYALQKAREDHEVLYEEINKFDPWEEYSQYQSKVAYFFAFSRRIFRSETHIVLIAASLVEALANMFYSERADSEMFAILERATPIEKWLTLPKIYIPSYFLPKGGKLYNTLKLLITRRNSILHPKPQMLKREGLIHRGNLTKKTKDEYKLHLDFCKLPSLLVHNLKNHDSSAGTMLEIMFSMLPETKKNPLFK
jgi:hypothetical protein